MRSPNLLRNTLIVMSGYLITKVVALVREPLIARAFGTSEQLDAYYAAFNIPDLLFTLIAGGALASVFIPIYADAMQQRLSTSASSSTVASPPDPYALYLAFMREHQGDEAQLVP